MREAECDLTDESILSAASVIRTLSEECAIPSSEYGSYIVMANRLEDIVEYRQEEREESEDKVIPIPEEVLNAESAAEVVKFVHGEPDQ